MASIASLVYVGPYVTSLGETRFLPNAGARIRRPLPNPYLAGPLSFCPTVQDRPILGQIWPRGFGLIGAGMAIPVFGYIYRDSNQTIIENTPTFIEFTDAEFDDHSMWSIANPSRIDIVRSGIYIIHSQIKLISASASGIPILTIYKNGNPISDAILPIVGITGSGYESFSPSVVLQQLEVNDYIQLKFEWQSIDSIDIIGGLTNTYIQIASWG